METKEEEKKKLSKNLKILIFVAIVLFSLAAIFIIGYNLGKSQSPATNDQVTKIDSAQTNSVQNESTQTDSVQNESTQTVIIDEKTGKAFIEGPDPKDWVKNFGKDVLVYRGLIETSENFNSDQEVYCLADRNNWLNRGEVPNVERWRVIPPNEHGKKAYPDYWLVRGMAGDEFLPAQNKDKKLNKNSFNENSWKGRYVKLEIADYAKPQWRGARGIWLSAKNDYWRSLNKKKNN